MGKGAAGKGGNGELTRATGRRANPGQTHPFAGVELVPSSKRSVCHLYFNLAPLLIHLVFYAGPG
jgi:hypothetical protein